MEAILTSQLCEIWVLSAYISILTVISPVISMRNELCCSRHTHPALSAELAVSVELSVPLESCSAV